MIIRVPISLKGPAAGNLDNFIRDIACVTQRGSNPFIRRKRKIPTCIQDYPNPFNPFSKSFSHDYRCVDTFLRYMHIDLSVTRDSVGISMTHVPAFVPREVLLENKFRFDKDGKLPMIRVMAPVVKVDFWGKISAKKGHEIIIGEIREIIYDLSRRGFYFGLITFDRFQSVDSIQILRSNGYRAGHLSVDRTSNALLLDNDNELGYVKRSTEGNYNAAQTTIKDLLYDDRLLLPNSTNVGYEKDWFITELSLLQEIPKTGKIDHPPGGSSDVEQSIAGGAFHCVNNERMASETLTEAEIKSLKDEYYTNTEEFFENGLIKKHKTENTEEEDLYYGSREI